MEQDVEINRVYLVHLLIAVIAVICVNLLSNYVMAGMVGALYVWLMFKIEQYAPVIVESR